MTWQVWICAVFVCIVLALPVSAQVAAMRAQDEAQAAHWFREAAQKGHARAQYNLGSMCFNGNGVAKDYVQAHMWLSLAASRAKGGRNLCVPPDESVAPGLH
jgi:uncharacterized membrane protein